MRSKNPAFSSGRGSSSTGVGGVSTATADCCGASSSFPKPKNSRSFTATIIENEKRRAVSTAFDWDQRQVLPIRCVDLAGRHRCGSSGGGSRGSLLLNHPRSMELHAPALKYRSDGSNDARIELRVRQ